MFWNQFLYNKRVSLYVPFLFWRTWNSEEKVGKENSFKNINIQCLFCCIEIYWNWYFWYWFHAVCYTWIRDTIHGTLTLHKLWLHPQIISLAIKWYAVWYVFICSYGSLLKSQSERDAADLHFSSSTSASNGSSEEEEITSHNNVVAAAVRNNTRHGGISYVLISLYRPVINWSEKRKYFFF